MGRTVKNRTPIRPKPVERIELSTKHVGLRAAAAVIFLVVGASALAYAFVNFLNGERGWRKIEVSTGAITCADEFVFMYDVGSSGSVHAENRALLNLYSELSKSAYEIFNAEVEIENINNLWYINHHPNEEIEVDKWLYSAIEKTVDSGSRYIYLGPAYSIYDSLYYMTSPDYAKDYDPSLNPELAVLYQQISDFAKSEDNISLELLGDNKIKLNVSEEYLEFAEDNALDRFIDFYWMKNAYICDYLAERISSSGYTHGVISSYDGFARCLSKTDETFEHVIFCEYEGHIQSAAVMEYTGPKSIVCLRDYSSVGEGGGSYAPFLSLSDGKPLSAIEELMGYSDEKGCFDIALELAEIYIAEKLDKTAVSALSENGIETVYCQGNRVICSDPNIRLTNVLSGDEEY